MKDKLATWALLLFLGGAGYACARASAYFSHKSQTTLSRWSKVECLIESQLRAGPDESAPKPPEPGAEGHVARGVTNYSNADIALSDVQIVAPSFLEPEIKGADVKGFSGLSPPRVGVTFAFTPSAGGGAEVGSWPVHFTANAVISKNYWDRQLKAAGQELARLESSGTPGEQERARSRLGRLQEQAEQLSRPHTLSGACGLMFDSVSDAGGPAAKWAARLLGVVAVLLLGACGLICVFYLMKLKEDDLEP